MRGRLSGIEARRVTKQGEKKTRPLSDPYVAWRKKGEQVGGLRAVEMYV